MTILVFAYAAAVIAATRRLAAQQILHADQGIDVSRRTYEDYTNKSADLQAHMKRLEEKATQIFTLYEMTKEISRNFNAEDAFSVFKNKLKENVSFEECQLVEPFSPDVNKFKSSSQYHVISLRGKRRLLGNIAIKGVAERDKEKVMILAHQFALTLRRIRLYQEVERLAITDSLTEVHTRRYILERFEEEMSRARSRNMHLSFLMIDIDHFKRFNDQFGHLTGDQILREISRLIREHIREIDIIGRYGGEEFCVVLPDTDRNGAYYVAERIRSAVEATPVKAYDTTIRSTLSIGIATFPDDGKASSELLDKADWALYRAKKSGRNTICAFGVYKEEK